MACRGIRGAITVTENTAAAIKAATRALLEHIVTANAVNIADIASVIFTATPDLNAAYPALAAREMGWNHTPLLCMQEMAVLGSLPRCIRVLLHWNTDRAQTDIHHIYLGEAQALRPDITNHE
ncbi:MAG TPA: chorismate mutase [Anaerolineae bacterium]|nr:chorismate mutase [Anaerolineae bacterium]HQK13618.1 chorismate mutase [Anaerolineae bacterium]